MRQDKHCLNCGTEVPERYCTHCGQENAVTHESFGHLVKHFVGDVLHYDSQFLTTLKYLLFRPGRLTKEYIAGRRAAYVNPIKLYIFISFIFFLLLAMIPNGQGHGEGGHNKVSIEKGGDPVPVVLDALTAVDDTLQKVLDEGGVHRKDSLIVVTGLPGAKGRYRTLHEYDSVQQQLPADKRDGALERRLRRRTLDMKEHYEEGSFWEAIKHHGPKLMFVLLPLFALFLKGIYNWKRWYYTDHAIFSLHLHCFAFIVLMLALLLDHWFSDSDTFTGYGLLLIFGYLVFALRNAYGQSFLRSLWKGTVLMFVYGISFAFVFAFFVLLLFAVIL
ncbi:uncharacterized protein DUF3667 [Chitinophaga japonensis]|uniref:Uncharacterized protein DUF3667 n=1 Tax=Chitinophaga japonensis TaxID=104662 RepID=A0A562SUN4_CHIJA|nr:uncharacterized protein DUF3667 [Chitinophaga japonensis]